MGKTMQMERTPFIVYELFKRKINRRNQIINPTRDRREWERQHRKERTPFFVCSEFKRKINRRSQNIYRARDRREN